MKKTFYKIPEERITAIFKAAFRCDEKSASRNVHGFLSEWLDDIEEFHVIEETEDEIEENQSTPILDYIPKGFDPIAHQQQAREWHEISKRYEAYSRIMFQGD